MKKTQMLLLAIVLSVGFFYFFLQLRENPDILVRAENCDLIASTCAATYQQKKLFTIELIPKPISNKSPFQIIFELKNPEYEVDQVEIKFIGIDMELSSSASLFSKDGKEFRGQGNLPFCTLKKMSWRLSLRFSAFNKLNKQNKKVFYFLQQFDVIN